MMSCAVRATGRRGADATASRVDTTARGTPANCRIADRSTDRCNEYAGSIISPLNIKYDYSDVSCSNNGGNEYRTDGDAGSRDGKNFRYFQDATSSSLANVRLVGHQVLIELSDAAAREEQQRRGCGGG
ncbi:hypothetical protein U1Q18_046285 [Sarracenia purpurea var. burkii]